MKKTIIIIKKDKRRDNKILPWIILFSILGSLGAITAAASFMLLKEKTQKFVVSLLISYATGVLLTASLLGLIPEAIESSGGEPHYIMPFVIGIAPFLRVH